MLQQALGGRGGKRSAIEASYMAFDLLYYDGHDLTGMDLAARRHILLGIIPAGSEGTLKLSGEVHADGEAVFRAACEHGLEDIIAKDRTAPYQSGRNGEG